MLHTFISHLLERRHFWRHATFGEVAELYAARLLRMTATSLISMFVAIYMLMNGYSLLFIAGYYAVFYLFRALVALPCAWLTARYGPKHGMLIANVINIPSLVAFSLLPQYGLWALAVFTVCQGISMVLYDICHNTDFSKVKHDDHAGKEISFMNIMDRVAAGISPLIGGIVAWLIGPQVTILLAAVLFAVAAVPLFRTAEPVMTRQKLSFRGFSWATTWRSMVAEGAIGVDTSVTVAMWPLFLALVVFAGSGNTVYAQIGGLATITLFVGFIASQMYGVLIDRRRGRQLLEYSTATNAFVHIVRPFVLTPLSAALTNILNEAATTGYSMAFMRGMFDLADRSGHRIAYLGMMAIALNVGAALGFVVLFVAILLLGNITGLQLGFVVAGLLVLLTAWARFPLYRRAV